MTDVIEESLLLTKQFKYNSIPFNSILLSWETRVNVAKATELDNKQN
jgi:hypothetical protein